MLAIAAGAAGVLAIARGEFNMTNDFGWTLADNAGWAHMGGWGWGMAIFGWLFMTMLVIGVVWALWSSTRRSEPAAPTPRTARDLLDDRYARGDIDRDDYFEHKSDLEV